MHPADQRFARDGFERCAAVGGAKVVCGDDHIMLFGGTYQSGPLRLLPRQSSDLPALRAECISQRARHGVHAAPSGLF